MKKRMQDEVEGEKHGRMTCVWDVTCDEARSCRVTFNWWYGKQPRHRQKVGVSHLPVMETKIFNKVF